MEMRLSESHQVDHAHAAALAATGRAPVYFAKAARAADEVTRVGMPDEILPQRRIGVVVEKRGDAPGEGGRFFKDHGLTLRQRRSLSKRHLRLPTP